MALLQCPECKQEVSTHATSCPHCGNPIAAIIPAEQVSTTSIAEKTEKKDKQKFRLLRTLKIGIAATLILCITAFALFKIPATKAFTQNALHNVSMFFIRLQNSPRQTLSNIFQSDSVVKVGSKVFTPQPNLPLTETKINKDGTKIYALEKNDIFGYQFYTAKIDSSTSIDIGSEPKQRIARLLNTLTFPKRLTKNLAIINVDPAAAKPTDKLNIPWGGMNATIAIQPMVGSYQGVYGGSVISLNNLTGYSLSVITHELGHHIASQMNDAEWSQYYKLRGIPASTPRSGSNWNLSPNEDFAEVYKNTYRQGDSGEWQVKTEYGAIIPNSEFLEMSTPCGMIRDSTELESCRKKNVGADFYGTPVYSRQVSESTKQFIKSIIARLH